ncbi:MAG: ion transporter [Lachnospiraceae bacterium]|nr:ion transporter [Lachnospiraceae bacterium]
MTDNSKSLKKRIFDIIQIGNVGDIPSRLFDIGITVVILASLAAAICSTYDELDAYSGLINGVEMVTVIIFTIEYILRVWTADILYPDRSFGRAVLSFIFSGTGIVDLLTFFPYYLPVFLPAGAVAFRIFRVFRIFRLFKINSRYDAFNVIIDVIMRKRKQIFSSVVMVLILMIASSLCMYSMEHEVQPEVFKNAFSGIWWSASTLLTIGYGDIYPITVGGRIMAIVISFLGVGMVAIPTGIISAGFVESYTRLHRNNADSKNLSSGVFSCILDSDHPWHNRKVSEITLPPRSIIASIVRNGNEIPVSEDTVLLEDDMIILTDTKKPSG